MQIHFCERCNQRCTDADLTSGRAIRAGDAIYCKKCAAEIPPTPEGGARRKRTPSDLHLPVRQTPPRPISRNNLPTVKRSSPQSGTAPPSGTRRATPGRHSPALGTRAQAKKREPPATTWYLLAIAGALGGLIIGAVLVMGGRQRPGTAPHAPPKGNVPPAKRDAEQKTEQKTTPESSAPTVPAKREEPKISIREELAEAKYKEAWELLQKKPKDEAAAIEVLENLIATYRGAEWAQKGETLGRTLEGWDKPKPSPVPRGLMRPRQWMPKLWCLGPFDSPNIQEPALHVSPDNIQLDKEYAGRGDATLRWRKIPFAKASDLHVNLHAEMEEDNVLAYVYTFVVSTEDQNATLRVHADDGVRAWLNGADAGSREGPSGIDKPPLDAKVQLKKGNNLLLLRITQGGSQWEFKMEIVGEQSSPSLELPPKPQG